MLESEFKERTMKTDTVQAQELYSDKSKIQQLTTYITHNFTPDFDLVFSEDYTAITVATYAVNNSICCKNLAYVRKQLRIIKINYQNF